MMKEMTDFFRDDSEKFFEKYQRYPATPYSEHLNHDLFIGEPTSSDWIRWQAIPQDKAIDWAPIENSIGFKLRDDIKEYFSSYYFFNTAATVGKATVYLRKIGSIEEVGKNCLLWARIAKTSIPKKQCIVIGAATIDEDDGYTIFVDNKTGAVFCKEFDTMNEVQLSDSISSFFEKMEA